MQCDSIISEKAPTTTYIYMMFFVGLPLEASLNIAVVLLDRKQKSTEVWTESAKHGASTPKVTVRILNF